MTIDLLARCVWIKECATELHKDVLRRKRDRILNQIAVLRSDLADIEKAVSAWEERE